MIVYNPTSPAVSVFFRRLLDLHPQGQWKKLDRRQIEQIGEQDPEARRILSDNKAISDREGFFEVILEHKREQIETDRFNRIELSLYRVCR